MYLTTFLVNLVLLLSLAAAEQWPYNRFDVTRKEDTGRFVADTSSPEFSDNPDNLFLGWLRSVVEKDETGQLQQAFINGTIPEHIHHITDLREHLAVPEVPPKSTVLPGEIGVGPVLPGDSHQAATKLFGHLGYPIDTRCTVDKTWWWYRTYDGSCNWLQKDEISYGAAGTAKSRDFNQHYYADGVSKPREGPNARLVSNAFFKRKKALYYEHTPLLLGLIEFIMHDVTYSQDSVSEFVDVPVLENEADGFYKNTTMRVWRTEKMPGTGTSKDNPRENLNMATTWLDLSALYGSSPSVAMKLRAMKGGKLLAQEVLANGTVSAASYLPFNSMDVPTRTRPGIDPETLFAGGDPRTNEDWMLLGVHTLFLREHNRLCDILAKQHPEYDDERLYQTIRLVMGAKYSLLANSYQMAYWTDKMPWPRDDGFPLYRQMYGESALKINPANTYPWPLVTKGGKPMVVSAEMAVVYRFHEFIISSFPIKDGANNTIREQNLFGTAFNASGFIDTGLERVLRGMVSSHIPNFKSGVDENFRTAGVYRGKPFDIVTWSIIHEREQGLPTFNTYFREYNKGDPKVVVPIRTKFEQFSSDPEMVANLKKLYQHPDNVDLVVGIQLDEENFPGTTVPKSALIISLFSLFGMGNSDRFSTGFAMMRCFLVNKPWDCHPTNALEDLLWAPKKVDGFPNFRWYDTFWLTELDFQAHGTNLLWRMITENTEIKCVQHSPLFPADPVTNPVLCALPPQKPDPKSLGLTAVELILKYIQIYRVQLITFLVVSIGTIVYARWHKTKNQPPVLHGLPVLGEALNFGKDARGVLTKGMQKFGSSMSSCFGIKLANMTHFVITKKEDMLMIMEDSPYEVKFNNTAFMRAVNTPIITKENNFDSDLHNKLLREHFSDPKTVAAFTSVVEEAARSYLTKNPLAAPDGKVQHHSGLNDYLNNYIIYVISRLMIGPKGFDDPNLLKTFLKFNEDAIKAMGMASLLPSFLKFIAKISINKDFRVIHEAVLPIIKQRRANPPKGGLLANPVFVDFIIDVVEGDERVADLIAITTWVGLTNLTAPLSSTVLDIINEPNLQTTILQSLSTATLAHLNTFTPSTNPNPWSTLRSSTLESIRLCGPATAPARTIQQPVHLASNPKQILPKGEAITLSSFYVHRQSWAHGSTADRFQHDRFQRQDINIGEPDFISWGLKGPHLCPGRWFAQAAIMVMTKALLARFDFKPDRILSSDEKYLYQGGFVIRKEVGIDVKVRT